MEEIWKSITGFEGLYEVSNLGRVRTVARVAVVTYKSGVVKNYSIKSIVMKCRQSRGLYDTVGLKKYNGKRITVGVHRLVLCSFNGESLDTSKVVNHVDGNPSNNHLENLEFVTHQENLLHGHRAIVPNRREKWLNEFQLPTR